MVSGGKLDAFLLACNVDLQVVVKKIKINLCWALTVFGAVLEESRLARCAELPW